MGQILDWRPVKVPQEIMWYQVGCTPLDPGQQAHGQGLEHVKWLINLVMVECTLV
jgi:hypothetical protein